MRTGDSRACLHISSHVWIQLRALRVTNSSCAFQNFLDFFFSFQVLLIRG